MLVNVFPEIQFDFASFQGSAGVLRRKIPGIQCVRIFLPSLTHDPE